MSFFSSGHFCFWFQMMVCTKNCPQTSKPLVCLFLYSLSVSPLLLLFTSAPGCKCPCWFQPRTSRSPPRANLLPLGSQSPFPLYFSLCPWLGGSWRRLSSSLLTPGEQGWQVRSGQLVVLLRSVGQLAWSLLARIARPTCNRFSDAADTETIRPPTCPPFCPPSNTHTT